MVNWESEPKEGVSQILNFQHCCARQFGATAGAMHVVTMMMMTMNRRTCVPASSSKYCCAASSWSSSLLSFCIHATAFLPHAYSTLDAWHQHAYDWSPRGIPQKVWSAVGFARNIAVSARTPPSCHGGATESCKIPRKADTLSEGSHQEYQPHDTWYLAYYGNPCRWTT